MKNSFQDNVSFLCELLNSMYDLIITNLKELKFTERDAMIISILLHRYCEKTEPAIENWLTKCRRSDKKLLNASSSDLLQKVFNNLQHALSQSITIVKGNEITINKNNPDNP